MSPAVRSATPATNSASLKSCRARASVSSVRCGKPNGPQVVKSHSIVVRKARGWMIEPVEESAEAMRLARKAVHLGGDDPVALSTDGYAFASIAREFDDAAAFMDRGLALNPNAAQIWTFSGWLRVW